MFVEISKRKGDGSRSSREKSLANTKDLLVFLVEVRDGKCRGLADKLKDGPINSRSLSFALKTMIN